MCLFLCWRVSRGEKHCRVSVMLAVPRVNTVVTVDVLMVWTAPLGSFPFITSVFAVPRTRLKCVLFSCLVVCVIDFRLARLNLLDCDRLAML